MAKMRKAGHKPAKGKATAVTPRTEIGRRVRELRIAAQLKLKDMGELLGVDTSTYQRHERSGTFQADRIAVIAKVFGVPLEEITGEPRTRSLASRITRALPIMSIALKPEMHHEVGICYPKRSISTKAYAVEMPDNSMQSGRGGAGSFEQGDWLIVDPSAPLRTGSIVHAVDPTTDENLVRRYVPLHVSDLRAPGFILKSANSDYPEIYVSARHKNTVLGVVIEMGRMVP